MPNAIAFKVLIDDIYQVCICMRKDGMWDENDMLLLKESPTSKELYDALHDTHFHVIFITAEQVDDSLSISYTDSTFLYKPQIASDMYSTGEFLSTVEDGYIKNYGD